MLDLRSEGLKTLGTDFRWSKTGQKSVNLSKKDTVVNRFYLNQLTNGVINDITDGVNGE